jgi:hypothetical protein
MPPDGLLLENRSGDLHVSQSAGLSARAQDYAARTSGPMGDHPKTVNMPNFCRVFRQSQFPASRELSREFTKIGVTAFATLLPHLVPRRWEWQHKATSSQLAEQIAL